MIEKVMRQAEVTEDQGSLEDEIDYVMNNFALDSFNISVYPEDTEDISDVYDDVDWSNPSAYSRSAKAGSVATPAATTKKPRSAEVFVTEEAASSSNSHKPQRYSMDCDDDTSEEWWQTNADTVQDYSAGTVQVCSAGIAEVPTSTLKRGANGDNLHSVFANNFCENPQDTSSGTLQVCAAGAAQDCSAFTEDFTCASWSTSSLSRRPAEAAASPCEDRSSSKVQKTNVLSFDFNVENDLKCKIVSYSYLKYLCPEVHFEKFAKNKIKNYKSGRPIIGGIFMIE